MKTWWKGKEKPWKKEEFKKGRRKKKKKKQQQGKKKKKDWDPEFLQFSCFLSQNLERMLHQSLSASTLFPPVFTVSTLGTHI